MKVIGIGIYTRQPDRLIAFYRDKLGLAIQADSWEGQQFSYGQIGALSFNIYQHDKSPTPGQTESAMSFIVEVDDLVDWCNVRRRRGVQFAQLPGKLANGAVMAILRDPDGNTIHLRQRQVAPAAAAPAGVAPAPGRKS